LLPGDRTEQARMAYLRDPEWTAPILWRSEFRNVLAQYLRRNALTLDEATGVAAAAEGILANREHLVESNDVLKLCSASGCSAYDCEFVALAQRLDISLVTADSQVLRNFSVAVSLEKFVAA